MFQPQNVRQQITTTNKHEKEKQKNNEINTAPTPLASPPSSTATQTVSPAQRKRFVYQTQSVFRSLTKHTAVVQKQKNNEIITEPTPPNPEPSTPTTHKPYPLFSISLLAFKHSLFWFRSVSKQTTRHYSTHHSKQTTRHHSTHHNRV